MGTMSSRRTFIESAITVAGLTGASRLLGMTRHPHPIVPQIRHRYHIGSRSFLGWSALMGS